MLEVVVVPACFIGSGLIGLRLGTPARVAGGLVALGCCHLLAFLGSWQALEAGSPSDVWVHLASQLLFVGGFVALVWLAATYPDRRPSTTLIAVAATVGATGPVVAAVSGATPAVINDRRELGPVIHLVPERVADFAVVPVLLLPLLAIGAFALHYRSADQDDRAAMKWPLGALGMLAAFVVAGNLLGPGHEATVTVLFLLGAPLFPLAVAFGPVLRRLEALTSDLAEARERLIQRTRPAVPDGVLARLSPREVTVLEKMAEGMANPVIARSMHLSLSSVEKHATSIFRKLEIPEGPEVHRRVAAVVAYRDAVEGARGES